MIYIYIHICTINSQLAYETKAGNTLDRSVPRHSSVLSTRPFRCRSELSCSQSMQQAPRGVPQKKNGKWRIYLVYNGQNPTEMDDLQAQLW